MKLNVHPFRTALRTGRMPFTRIVPAIVLACGLLAAIATTAIGVNQLRLQSDQSAALRSQLLARTLAARLAGLPLADREWIIERASIRSGAELLLVNEDGSVMVDGTVVPPHAPGIVQLLRVGQGETQTTFGRVRFTAADVPGNGALNVLAFVPAPKQPVSTESLVRLVGAFTGILLGVAALVAFALSRDARSDVAFVTRRIVEMARPDANPAGALIPIRSIDQVGAMTLAFNNLVERFTHYQVPHAPILGIQEALAQPQACERQMVVETEHQKLGKIPIVNRSIRFTGAEQPVPAAPPVLGQHTDDILKDVLDLTPEQIQTLRASGVVS